MAEKKVSKTARAAEKHKLAKAAVKACPDCGTALQPVKFVNEHGGKGRMYWYCEMCGRKTPTKGGR